MTCPNCGEFNACDDDECMCVYCGYVFGSSEYYEPDLDNQGTAQDEERKILQRQREAKS